MKDKSKVEAVLKQYTDSLDALTRGCKTLAEDLGTRRVSHGVFGGQVALLDEQTGDLKAAQTVCIARRGLLVYDYANSGTEHTQRARTDPQTGARYNRVLSWDELRGHPGWLADCYRALYGDATGTKA